MLAHDSTMAENGNFPLASNEIVHQKSCIFCQIAQGKDPKTKLLYEDEEVVVFQDIKPAAPHHYLAIPRTHIRDAKHLKKSHIPLVEKLLHAGKHVLQEQGGNTEEARYGFHWPPYNSEYHLHFHIVSPVGKILFKYKLRNKYNPKGHVFKSYDWMMDRLQNMPDEPES